MNKFDKKAANLATLPLVAALLVIAIPLFEIDGSEAVFTFKYWGGGENFNRMEVVRNFALIVGGFLGLWLAWRRIVLMDRQTTVALQDSKQKEMDHVAARFENAIALLESDSEMSRIAGVGAVRDLALKNSEEYLFQATDVIAAFIRTNGAAATGRAAHGPDVSEAFRTIGQFLKVGKAPGKINFGQSGYVINLRGVSFDGMVVEEWNFRNVDCDGATFDDTEFQECLISSSVASRKQFTGVFFSICEFSGQVRDANFGNAYFLHCDFSLARFIECDFSRTEIEFSQKIRREIRAFDFFPAHQEIFQSCRFDAAVIEVSISFGSFDNDANFLPEDFKNCWVTDTSMVPPNMIANQPTLDVVITTRPTDDGGFYIYFEEGGTEGNSASTQAE